MPHGEIRCVDRAPARSSPDANRDPSLESFRSRWGFVSVGRLDHWAYRSSPRRCRYKAPSPRRSSVTAAPVRILPRHRDRSGTDRERQQPSPRCPWSVPRVFLRSRWMMARPQAGHDERDDAHREARIGGSGGHHTLPSRDSGRPLRPARSGQASMTGRLPPAFGRRWHTAWPDAGSYPSAPTS